MVSRDEPSFINASDLLSGVSLVFSTKQLGRHGVQGITLSPNSASFSVLSEQASSLSSACSKGSRVQGRGHVSTVHARSSARLGQRPASFPAASALPVQMSPPTSRLSPARPARSEW